MIKTINKNEYGQLYPFTKSFIIRGIGYQSDIFENTYVGFNEFTFKKYILLRVGHSFQLYYPIPDAINLKIKYKTRKITLYSSNKGQIFNFSKFICQAREPNVYTGRGIRIKKIVYRRKIGKKEGKKGKL